ncbi:hypothetical protein B0H13DRAFT_2386037 [Mycena leptocephala]|nr:hypothetical protein B0H13DRAFT_2386037 [Mycena leptocephala]
MAHDGLFEQRLRAQLPPARPDPTVNFPARLVGLSVLVSVSWTARPPAWAQRSAQQLAPSARQTHPAPQRHHPTTSSAHPDTSAPPLARSSTTARQPPRLIGPRVHPAFSLRVLNTPTTNQNPRTPKTSSARASAGALCPPLVRHILRSTLSWLAAHTPARALMSTSNLLLDSSACAFIPIVLSHVDLHARPRSPSHTPPSVHRPTSSARTSTRQPPPRLFFRSTPSPPPKHLNPQTAAKPPKNTSNPNTLRP